MIDLPEERCACGAIRTHLRGFLIAIISGPLGREEIHHREVDCAVCGRSESWHDREIHLLGLSRRTLVRCDCSELLYRALADRD